MIAHRYTRELFVVGLILALFVAASYFSQASSKLLIDSIGIYGSYGMAIYVIGAIIATIIAPLSFLPILPIAVALWGSFNAALLSIFAWTVGSIIIFLIARRFGEPIVRHFVGKRKMQYIHDLLPINYIFLAVIVLRILLPVDLVSYALGLFNVMPFWPYVLATLIGITPFAFTFSYLAEMPVVLQISALTVGLFVIALGFPHVQRKYKEIFSKEN